MKILLLHLSDMHIKAHDNCVFGKIDKIHRAVQNLTAGIDNLFMVVSGDITNSGEELEYDQAKHLLDSIKMRIENYSRNKVCMIIVPGNHDCDFKMNTKTREILIKDIQQNGDASIDKDVVNQCCALQDGFFKLMGCYKDDGVELLADKLVRIIQYHVGRFNITFNCYNTAWMSEIVEQPGRMHFPIALYSPKDFMVGTGLSIGVLHHTSNWLNPQNARRFATHLNNTSHIVLTGHEHVASKSRRDDLEGTTTFYIEGAVLQQEGKGEESGFNVLLVDLETEKHKVCQYVWNGEIYYPAKESDWYSYKSTKLMSGLSFVIDSEFERNFLDDFGAQIRHPNKHEIVLEDLFVYPHLRDLIVEKGHDRDILKDVIEGKCLCEIHEDGNKVLLVGSENSGKTALCKMLFKTYYKNDYVPVYVDGRKLRSTSIGYFNKVVAGCFADQYSGHTDSVERFKQLDNNRKLVIIDDFDKVKLNIRYRSVLLNNINEHYPNVIITGSDLFPIGEILSEEKQKEFAIENYRQYQILPFGHLMRNMLVEKWNTLGKEEYIDEKELIRKSDEAQQILNAIIGRNYVPSYPIFLLIILQTIEAGHPYNLEESSFGYYYQYLIIEAIGRIVKTNEEIDAYHTFIMELAYHLFSNRSREISRYDFNEFHAWYCKEYDVSPSFASLVNPDQLLDNSVSAKILEKSEGGYRFKYRYIYNFFVARYLASNIGSPAIRQEMSEMCKRLYREEFADIIVFLTHHSKDSFILNEILVNARSIFVQSKPVEFKADMSTVNKLLTEVPKLVLERRDVRKHRESKLRMKDEKELLEKLESSEDNGEIPDSREPLLRLDLVGELNLAFKMIEILGQVLKNYHGSLRGPVKLTLGEEAFLLGLRALNPFYEILEQKKDYLVRRIGVLVDKRKLGDERRIENVSRMLLFTLYAMMSYGFVKKISESVGSEHLSRTFSKIVNKYDITSVKLVDISIKLDFFRDFPYGDIRNLKEKVIGNLLPYALLREMVLEYLYMFPTTFKQRQRISGLLDIPMLEQRIIDATSTQKMR